MSGIYKTYALTFDGTPSEYIYGDHFGISITGVGYMLNDTPVLPTSGSVSIEWSYDGLTWQLFNGGAYNLPNGASGANANAAMRYIRAIGQIDGADKIVVGLRLDNDGVNNNYPATVVSPFEQATKNGRSLSSSFSVTVPANSEYSVNVQSNKQYAVRFVRAEGLFLEYYNGSADGTLVGLGSFYTLNNLISGDFHAGVEVFNGYPLGQRVMSASNQISDSFYPNGSFSIELANRTDADVSTFVSIGIEGIDGSRQGILTADTQIEANTEMSDYNGTN